MNRFKDQAQADRDPQETAEWLEALQAVIEREGPERAHFLLEHLVDFTRRSGGYLPYDATTAYINTIPPHLEAKSPGNHEIERRIRSLTRWNAMAIVVRAGMRGGELGGHIASFASACTLYDVGLNHFFRGPDHPSGGDLVYFQGHSSPGIYARAYLEGRLDEAQLDRFRQEVEGGGLSSYPHPWLMPDFWQFPTVSMGLGPIMAIYQARFLKYLHDRGIADCSDRKVWCFLGDGETDEPESLGAISLAGREGLDNLIFVVNCNLQRLDGPVRGNGKIIQELEGVFRGAGWNVIKVIWGSRWDGLLARDSEGLLRRRMEEAVDGEYQNYKAKGGAYTREHFFGAYPELKAMVANMSDDEIWRLNRGGHDAHKVYAAYHAASQHAGEPTVILAKTVKGYGMGSAGEAQNITHQQKKMDADAVRAFRDRFNVPVADEDLPAVPYYHPGADSPEVGYLQERRTELGGPLPRRCHESLPLAVPDLDAFGPLLEATGEREISTTMTFVRALAVMLRDPNIKERIVPIVADEARTFGMEGMFRQLGIYSSVGQLYTPVDSDQLMFYKEDRQGQILQEGITEAGAMSSWIAAATSYSASGVPMIPFFIFYSMFGFQRVGDLAWAAGDQRARGFLIGGTSGRTTLNGEGLQHQDGHSHMLAGVQPNCVPYDPTFAYELAVILQDGLRRMYTQQEDVYYYVTVMNENYAHPAMPPGSEEGIRRGLYLLQEGGEGRNRVQLMGSGAILREVIAAAALLEQDFGVAADVWSATSFTGLRRDGEAVERHNRLNPGEERESWVARCLREREGPVVAATDYVRVFADQIRAFLPQETYIVLGTDGFGRSDTRENLRRFFEVDRRHVAFAALHGLYREGRLDQPALLAARERLGIDSSRPDPARA
ncbi:MAG: pyruvate dehydrogenase (acetyl-transferring), homodimeric type [Xanthomonadales bacterium]|nr:pyruvate dehydrogenase (acetyl-transferring), homodimeric type [Xanthomonadales bacterium]NIN58442.1 pyruvate dehydrogenase (acetyl-transferring), homodimeric type [Xanthomonadales bacterium]NIN74988.1 pyruvate dehydrogenase (acetyl-transferring), homodimeric type [Xanthomonadales bacterium]NIO13080.1 pyruvate dehydrogenase (acetyl-transferring), homodimeric type [Xanthomonadales bacterium]NIP10835.1 pyruvate dehydrogenase (acetyl-transferring), homodimeric type [Xanthomonadales bacterium]